MDKQEFLRIIRSLFGFKKSIIKPILPSEPVEVINDKRKTELHEAWNAGRKHPDKQTFEEWYEKRHKSFMIEE